MNEVEELIFDRIQEGNVDEVRRLLGEPSVRVDCLDEHGMTLLQHAAFKGKKELADLLLAHGADVNMNEHDNSYSTLMFGALSGNVEVVNSLLAAGAKTTPVNSVGRNAAQMAAFTGQHHVVTVINNYFPIDRLDYYTEVQGLEKEPRLRQDLTIPLHKMILMSNLNPVNTSRYLRDNVALLDEAYKIAKVLDHLCEKSMKTSDTNDVMAVKTHYLACVVRQCEKARTERGDTNLDAWIKNLLRQREPDMCLEFSEKFIRSTLREFPYPESELLQTMVRNLAEVKIGGHPTALSILSSGVNGQQFATQEDTACDACGNARAEKRCSACKYTSYCNKHCQKLHWFTHKKFCKKLGEDHQKFLEADKKRQEKESQEEKAEAEKQGKPEDKKKKPEDDQTQNGTSDIAKAESTEQAAASTEQAAASES